MYRTRWASQSRLDHTLEPQVEHVVQIHIAQQDADRSALRGPLFARMDLSILQHTCFQPAPDQADQARITDSMLDKPEQPLVVQAPEEVLQIRLQHPSGLGAGDNLVEGRQRMMGAPSWPSAKRARQKVLLVNGRQHLSGAALERPVRDSRDAQGAFLLLAGFRDIDTPDVRRSISLAVDRLKHRIDPFSEAFLRLCHRLAIHPGGRAARNSTEILEDSGLGEVLGPGGKSD